MVRLWPSRWGLGSGGWGVKSLSPQRGRGGSRTQHRTMVMKSQPSRLWIMGIWWRTCEKITPARPNIPTRTPRMRKRWRSQRRRLELSEEKQSRSVVGCGRSGKKWPRGAGYMFSAPQTNAVHCCENLWPDRPASRRISHMGPCTHEFRNPHKNTPIVFRHKSGDNMDKQHCATTKNNKPWQPKRQRNNHGQVRPF